MRKRILTAVAVVLACGAVMAAVVGPNRFRGILTGYDEVPAVSSVATGDFTARISNDETQIEWELNYSDLEGAVQQAHIHFGQEGVNGGIVVFLCTNLGNGPAGTQPCPAPPATITGIATASDMVGTATAQGIAPGEFGEFIRAIRAGRAYANVHTTKHPGGEIRDQLAPGDGHGKH